MRVFANLIWLAFAVGLAAQDHKAAPAPAAPQTDDAAQAHFVVEKGTRVPLSLINSISTKHAAEGDRVYLESAFPILVNGHMVIPPGSYVAGTVTQIKRPGRVKGRGELFVRFDSLTLPNGVTRDFRARIGSLDGRANEELDRAEGKVKSEGNKSGDARTVGEATAAGASVGVIAGSAAGHGAMGAGIGAAAGRGGGVDWRSALARPRCRPGARDHARNGTGSPAHLHGGRDRLQRGRRTPRRPARDRGAGHQTASIHSHSWPRRRQPLVLLIQRGQRS